MNKIQRTAATVVAASAILVNSVLPVLATTIEISGNGAGSDNYTQVNQISTTTVTQTNEAVVTNTIEAEADTGDNDAKFNTGGDVVIHTGDASATALVTNDLNSNYAEVDCCDAGDTDVLIEGNGAFSDNVVELNQHTATTLVQDNKANVSNRIEVEAETGENDANMNTGGDVTITTGSASVIAGASTTANSNWAMVGPGMGGDGGSVSLRILGNGAGSDNWIQANLAKSTTVVQDNLAHVHNDIDAEAETGENDAKFNTGGDVVISTGKALVSAAVDNMVNFNYADVDCGCAYDLSAKIAGNGADVGHDHHQCGQKPDECGGPMEGDNTIFANLMSMQTLLQGNGANLNNDLGKDVEAETGDNEIEMSTGEADGDPAIVTGDAEVLVGVSNAGNVNQVGGLSMPQFPFGDGFEWQFGWNWAMFWSFFGMN